MIDQPVLANTAIIVVDFKTPMLVCECLDSLAEEHELHKNFEVFVGDASSGDGSVERICAHITDKGYSWATCYDNGANLGFAAGNNLVLRRSVLNEQRFEYVFFLNPDTYTHQGAVHALTDFLLEHPEAGAVGSKLENVDGSPSAFGFRFPKPWREFFRGARSSVLDWLVPSAAINIEDIRERREVDWVSGAAFMVRRSVLDEVGLLDSRYFLYFEEVDFLFRVRKAGYQVWHEPASRVVHLAGRATGVRTETALEKPIPDYWLHSRWRYFSSHFGLLSAVNANFLFLLGDLVYRLHRAIRRKPIQNPPRLWKSYMSDGFSTQRLRSD